MKEIIHVTTYHSYELLFFMKIKYSWIQFALYKPKIYQFLFKGIYFVIYGIISEFTDKGQFQYLTNLKGPQEGTYLYTT